jgi:hypothetical protein
MRSGASLRPERRRTRSRALGEASSWALTVCFAGWMKGRGRAAALLADPRTQREWREGDPLAECSERSLRILK